MATPTALRATESWAVASRHRLRATVFTSIVTPILYLASMGLGLGSLVDHGGHRAPLGGVNYLAFVAPGLLAASAMQAAATESTWPVMASVKWVGTYKAMLATPLGPAAIAIGHLLWMAARITMTSLLFLLAVVAFGAEQSALVVLAVPVATLTGMAFAAPISAYSVSVDRDTGLAALMRFGIIPLFLFSGTFFPIGQLPGVIRPVAYFTPLWHGVELCRGLSVGTVTFSQALLHVSYLLLWTGGGAIVAVNRFRARLVT
jgi:lipooligosaccharide transport system permease protein